MTRAASVAAARQLILDRTQGPSVTTEVAIGDSAGRVLAANLIAPQPMPPFASSAMDGFASLPCPSGSPLNVVGESRAGHPFGGTLNVGEAIGISTGALAPDGVGVVPVEVVDVDEGLITPHEAIAAGDHVRFPGEDLPDGAVALSAGTLLTPAEISVAAACGFVTVPCVPHPRVAIVVTGDELVAGGEALGPGQIHESNGVGLRALAQRSGAKVVSVTRCADDPAATRDALASALAEADIVIASGGVSVGEHDHVRPALAALDVEEVFWRVPIKPGGPTWFGVGSAGQLVFGLPGNPAAAFVTFTLFASPVIRQALGLDPIPTPWPARLASPLPLRPRAQAVRVRLEPQPDGPPLAVPTGAQGSHRTTSMTGAWGLAMLAAGEGTLDAGELVLVEPLL